MKSYIIHYKQVGSDRESTTLPIAGQNEKEAVADFRRNALDPFTVVKVEEVKK